MNPELPDLKQIGVEALRDLLNNLTQAKGFILDQAPEFCQQLVMRGYVMPAMMAAFLFVGCAVSLLVCAWGFKGMVVEQKSTDAEMARFFAFLFGCIGGIVFFIATCANVMSCVSVYIAPKVFLVEEITRMIK